MPRLTRARLATGAAALISCGALTLGAAATASAHGQHHGHGPSGHGPSGHGPSGNGPSGHGPNSHGQNGRQGAAHFSARVFVSGAAIRHPLAGGSEPISDPDDITDLDGHIFVGFQNGVGPQGQASPSGNLDSTIVEFNRDGRVLAQWDITGKCDGVTADANTGQIIATVNEDANSSVYLINPVRGSNPVQYQYSEPLPSDGGTDAIEVYDGAVLISASAPGTTGAGAPQASYPAVYEVWFDRFNDIAYVNGLFSDEAAARIANVNDPNFGSSTNLALTDPDSNEDVPFYADRFADDFMLTSQGDEQQIFLGSPQGLSVLQLTASVDDSAWPTGSDGVLYTTDNSDNDVIAVTGPFVRGSEIAAVTPCDENSAPATCPGPGYPANYLGRIDPYTGVITAMNVSGPSFQPQGMLFVSGEQGW